MGLVTEDGKQERVEITNIDVYNYVDRLKATVQRYENPEPTKTEIYDHETQSDIIKSNTQN